MGRIRNTLLGAAIGGALSAPSAIAETAEPATATVPTEAPTQAASGTIARTDSTNSSVCASGLNF